MDFVLQILSWLTEEESNSIKQAQAECFANVKKKRKALGAAKCLPRKNLVDVELYALNILEMFLS